jgi:hypothetical protein
MDPLVAERFLVRVPQARSGSAFMDERAFNSERFPSGSTSMIGAPLSGNATRNRAVLQCQPRDSGQWRGSTKPWTKPRHGMGVPT